MLIPSAVIDDLCRAVSEAFDLGADVSEGTLLGEELSFDSFAWLEFLIAVEARYDILVLERISSYPLQTLGDLAELIVDESNSGVESGVNKQGVDE